jgi:hypothetical protein
MTLSRNESESPESLASLLDFIVNDQQENAKKILKKFPELLLAKGHVQDRIDRKFKNVTGLQLAVWTLNWRMRDMLITYMDKEEADKQIQEAITNGIEYTIPASLLLPEKAQEGLSSEQEVTIRETYFDILSYHQLLDIYISRDSQSAAKFTDEWPFLIPLAQSSAQDLCDLLEPKDDGSQSQSDSSSNEDSLYSEDEEDLYDWAFKSEVMCHFWHHVIPRAQSLLPVCFSEVYEHVPMSELIRITNLCEVLAEKFGDLDILPKQLTTPAEKNEDLIEFQSSTVPALDATLSSQVPGEKNNDVSMLHLMQLQRKSLFKPTDNNSDREKKVSTLITLAEASSCLNATLSKMSFLSPEKNALAILSQSHKQDTDLEEDPGIVYICR